MWDGGTIEPKPQPELERKAAEMLGPYADLKLKLASGKEVAVKRDDKLPTEAFALTVIAFANTRLPANFTDDVFLPAMSNLQALLTVQSAAAGDLRLAEVQLAKLAELPPAKTLVNIAYTAGAIGLELTPGAIDVLKRFPKLHSISLGATNADDAVLERLAELPALNDGLSLHGLGQSGKVTARGLTAVAKLPVWLLNLSGSPRAADFIRAMPGTLKAGNLNFWGCAIGDDDIKELAKCPSVSHLVLTATKITDAGLKHLERLKDLQFVDVTQTDVTKDGVASLAKTFPQCSIVWNGGTITPKKP